MSDLTELDGVGPTRSERLEEEGYQEVTDVASADHEDLAEDIDVPEDTALEFVVQAQNLIQVPETIEEEDEPENTEFDLEPKDVSDEVDETEDEEEEVVEAEEDSLSDEEIEEVVEEEIEEEYSVTLSFNERLEYDTFHDAVMSRWQDVYTSRQGAADALRKCLDGLDSHDSVSYELTESELNELHSAVSQQTTRYQGDNLIDQMDALNRVQEELDEQRREHLF